jgi:hypothetical protein
MQASIRHSASVRTYPRGATKNIAARRSVKSVKVMASSFYSLQAKDLEGMRTFCP